MLVKINGMPSELISLPPINTTVIENAFYSLHQPDSIKAVFENIYKVDVSLIQGVHDGIISVIGNNPIEVVLIWSGKLLMVIKELI